MGVLIDPHRLVDQQVEVDKSLDLLAELALSSLRPDLNSTSQASTVLTVLRMPLYQTPTTAHCILSTEHFSSSKAQIPPTIFPEQNDLVCLSNTPLLVSLSALACFL